MEAEIELLVGNDNAALQLQGHKALNGLSRPENLLFKESPQVGEIGSA